MRTLRRHHSDLPRRGAIGGGRTWRVGAWLALLVAVPLALARVPGFTDELLAAVHARYGAAAGERVAAWESLIRGGARLAEVEKLRRVNDFFNRMRFVSDDEHWGVRDYWATPIEFLGTRGGDCEDFSIAKYFTLAEMGVPVERLRITYVRALTQAQAHMVVAYYPSPGADPLILDNLVGDIRSGSDRRDLVPVYSFNGDGLWKAKARGEGRRVGGPGGIRLWRDLTARMVRERSPAAGASATGMVRKAHAEDGVPGVYE